ncbi:hypothetical protein GQX73_g10562 [Xylaria multiplex]|uniref:Heterokaryon incompatibility domain-containing protein n=1 Tax=Xylaria multiplex TaxID=323545 RepID=A0A7C8MQI3_9PEZI|nr:hypothetical protein GQX73_g10562 [Xylaria multiplex]
MYLLDCDITDKFRLVPFFNETIPPYAILSHTWEADDEEVTFRDILNDTGQTKSGYKKILFCAKQAKEDGLQFIWVDSCCIDRSSSADLSEAINSMFRFYQDAKNCYAYLSDVSTSQASKPRIHQSRWFTRSWTLQELLAPRNVDFFSREWERLGNKTELVQIIGPATKIPYTALVGEVPLSQFGVNERMAWAEGRHAKREEDTAYSLLGIFNVHMPAIYGEGQKSAFDRLRREISQSTQYVTHWRQRANRSSSQPL